MFEEAGATVKLLAAAGLASRSREGKQGRCQKEATFRVRERWNR